MSGLRKVRIRWDELRSHDLNPLKTLEQELWEAIEKEYRERREAYQTQGKDKKKRRRRPFRSASQESAGAS